MPTNNRPNGYQNPNYSNDFDSNNVPGYGLDNDPSSDNYSERRSNTYQNPGENHSQNHPERWQNQLNNNYNSQGGTEQGGAYFDKNSSFQTRENLERNSQGFFEGVGYPEYDPVLTKKPNRENKLIISSGKKMPLIILVISLVFSGGILLWTLKINQEAKEGISNSAKNSSQEKLSQSTKNSQNGSQTAQKSSASKNPESISFRMRYFGNAFWGRYMNDWSQASEQKFAYPFAGLETIPKLHGESWIAGLECPITPAKLTSAEQESILQFNCLPEYLPEASKYFQVFNLANNHTDNMQKYQGKDYDGFEQTRENLEKYKIQYFGHYDNAEIKDICEIVSLKAVSGNLNYDMNNLIFGSSSQASSQANSESKSKDYKDTKSEHYFPVAVCGYHNVFKLPTQEQIDRIKEYSKYFITISSNHQGQEYKTVADSLQKDVSQQMIKAGSDAIISDHVHVVQNTEVYEGKLIVYSMGNFMFDQQPKNFPNLGAKIAQSLSVAMDFNISWDSNLEAYLKLGQECLKFQDDCLKKAQEQNLKKPKYKIKYSAIGTDNSTRQPKKANKEAEIAILEQAGWPKTLKELEKN